VGIQRRLDAVPEHARALALGLGCKLVLTPALVVVLLWGFDAAPGTTAHVSVIEAAMPPMIGAGTVAAQANLAPRRVSTIIGRGIPSGRATATGWSWIFGRVGA